MGNMIILVGLPGAGKSTYYAKNLLKRYQRVNKDSIRGYNMKVDPTIVESQLIQLYLENDIDFVIDNTCFTKDYRKYYIDMALDFGFDIEIIYLKVDRKTRDERNQSREDYEIVPKKVIDYMERSFEEPDEHEGARIVTTVCS